MGDLLKEAFDIPDDDSLKISRNLELIFLHNNRREIPIPAPVEEPKEDETVQVKKEETNDEESELVDKLGDAVENLVEETNDEEEEAEINDESEEKQDATQEEE